MAQIWVIYAQFWPKMRPLAIYSTLVHLIGLLLYIIIAGNKILLLVVVEVLAKKVSGPNLVKFGPI
jgi:hypothetical protein